MISKQVVVSVLFWAVVVCGLPVLATALKCNQYHTVLGTDVAVFECDLGAMCYTAQVLDSLGANNAAGGTAEGGCLSGTTSCTDILMNTIYKECFECVTDQCNTVVNFFQPENGPKEDASIKRLSRTWTTLIVAAAASFLLALC